MVRGELALRIDKMAHDHGISEAWLKKALAGKSINSGVRKEFERRVCQTWKHAYPDRAALHFPAWEDDAPWSTDSKEHQSDGKENRVLQLETNLECVQRDMDALARIQFRLPQAFRIGWHFSDRPFPANYRNEALELGLEKHIDNPSNSDILFKDASAILAQTYGPRTSGIFQMGLFLRLLISVGYADGVPWTLSRFRETLLDIHLDGDLISSFELYYNKWLANRGLPPGCQFYYLLFSALLQHTFDGTSVKDPLKHILEHISVMLKEAPSHYGSTKRIQQMMDLLEELKKALENTNFRRLV